MLKPLISTTLLASLVACDQPERAEPPTESTAEQDADFVRMATAGRMLADLQTYFASDAPAPATFTFDRLSFERGSSEIRPVDQQMIYALANALQNQQNARVRIVGYGDGQRSGTDSNQLAARRAASIVRALRKAGVESSRLEAAVGREANLGRAPQLIVLRK